MRIVYTVSVTMEGTRDESHRFWRALNDFEKEIRTYVPASVHVRAELPPSGEDVHDPMRSLEVAVAKLRAKDAERWRNIAIDCVYAARDPKWAGGDDEIEAIIQKWSK